MTLQKTIVLVGLMGAGKTTIGRLLGERLGVPFYDSDELIQEAQGVSISDIFKHIGEKGFREVELKTIEQDLKAAPHVLATGGGAYIQPDVRAVIDEQAITVWLKAELDVLVERVSRKNTRPLLEQGNKYHIMKELMDARYPIYEGADITVHSDEAPHERVVERIMEALEQHGE